MTFDSEFHGYGTQHGAGTEAPTVFPRFRMYVLTNLRVYERQFREVPLKALVYRTVSTKEDHP